MLYDEDMEHIQVLQRLNRAVRRRSRQMTTALLHTRLYTDSVVRDLMESPSEAQNALEKIRTLGGINCDSDNYEFIVAICLEALRVMREGHEKSAPIGQ